MDPFTLMAIMKAAEGVATGGSALIGAEGILGKSQEERLKELSRREELGTLGFSAEEQNRMMREMLNPIQARERQRELQQRAILSSGDLGASQSALAQMVLSDKEEAARAAAGEEFLQQNIEEKRRQEQEIRDLKKLQDEERQAKNQAILQMLTLGLAGGAETAQRKMSYEEMLKGQAAADATSAGAPPLTTEQLAQAEELMTYVPGGG